LAFSPHIKAVHEEKAVALKELELELMRTLGHASQRTDAELKLRKMEADVRRRGGMGCVVVVVVVVVVVAGWHA
jgi:hypothetical protein